MKSWQGGTCRNRGAVTRRRGEEWRLLVAQRAQDTKDPVEFTRDTHHRLCQEPDLVWLGDSLQISSQINWWKRGEKRGHWEGKGDRRPSLSKLRPINLC